MIQSGTLAFGPVDDTGEATGWTLHEGTGRRTFVSKDIRFSTPFGQVPKVIVALTGIEGGSNVINAYVDAVDVEAEEFNVSVVAQDALINSVRVAYIAYDNS